MQYRLILPGVDCSQKDGDGTYLGGRASLLVSEIVGTKYAQQQPTAARAIYYQLDILQQADDRSARFRIHLMPLKISISIEQPTNRWLILIGWYPMAWDVAISYALYTTVLWDIPWCTVSHYWEKPWYNIP